MACIHDADSLPAGVSKESEPCSVQLRNIERGKRWWQRKPEILAEEEGHVCSMSLPAPSRGWQGPNLTLTLPSFSGGTPIVPELLKYACRLTARIQPVKAMHISIPAPCAVRKQTDQASEDALRCVLTGRPVLALAFNDMVMRVAAPVLLNSKSACEIASAGACGAGAPA